MYFSKQLAKAENHGNLAVKRFIGLKIETIGIWYEKPSIRKIRCKIKLLISKRTVNKRWGKNWIAIKTDIWFKIATKW